MTYSGKPVSGVQFFELLNEDNKFCQEIGCCSLACSRLEVALIRFLTKNGIQPKKKAPLGMLINQAKKLLNKQEEDSLELINDQRNYMIHIRHKQLVIIES